MTNGEKYETAKERVRQFLLFCRANAPCDGCPLEGDEYEVNHCFCAYKWLDLNADGNNQKQETEEKK